jgi:hypothetical protein
MDINLSIIDKVISDACSAKTNDAKKISLRELRNVLRESKQLVLTPF